MRVHYIQQVPFEDLAYIYTWLIENGHTVTSSKAWQDPPYPSCEEIDLLIILGGPMNVHEDAVYPWLRSEKLFIKKNIDSKKPILGICLGSQLLSLLLGGTVIQNLQKEIGWFPVNINPTFNEWLGKPANASVLVFHWHGDTFAIPDGAINHAASAACSSQLFTFGDNIIGIQFHPEVTKMSIESMISNEGEELVKGTFVQERSEILEQSGNIKSANEFMADILKKLTRS